MLFSEPEVEAVSGLHRLPPGRWCSLGRYLDYTNWADRERFVELDRAIASMPATNEDVVNSLPWEVRPVTRGDARRRRIRFRPVIPGVRRVLIG